MLPRTLLRCCSRATAAPNGHWVAQAPVKSFSANSKFSRSKFTMPPGAWDSHVHVVNEEAFPFDANHPFRPKKADLNDLLKFEETIGINHVSLVAISVYGNDNALLLQRLRELQGRGRGVVSINPVTISDQELDEMHSMGVRGVRINLKSHNTGSGDKALTLKLTEHANTIRRLKWSLHLHVGFPEVAEIFNSIPDLGVEVVLDHMATPQTTTEPMAQRGYSKLIELLDRKLVWMKLSGLYRFNKTPRIDAYVKEVLRIAPTQVIWASDWPHTGGKDHNPGGSRERLQEYRKVDIPAFIQQCLGWCGGDDDLMHKILVDNPRRLWLYDG